MLTVRPTISFATGTDVVEMGDISRRDIEYGLGWKYTPARLRVLIRDPTKNVVVARFGMTLAGFGVMTYRETTANLDLLAVKPGYRRRGIGAQVFQWLESTAITAGISIVYVQVRKTNAGAVRFYEANGYQVVDEVSGYYHGKEDAAILSRCVRSMLEST